MEEYFCYPYPETKYNIKEINMFSKIKEFLFGKKAEPVASETPYKLEPVPVIEPAQAPATIPCGCGRSSSGFCVGLHNLSTEEWAVHPENKTVSAPAVAPVKKKTRSPAKEPVKTEAAPKRARAAKPKVVPAAPAAIKAKKTTRKKAST